MKGNIPKSASLCGVQVKVIFLNFITALCFHLIHIWTQYLFWVTENIFSKKLENVNKGNIQTTELAQ